MKPLIIIGIDPGTTTAYAILDIKGNLIEAGSSKSYDLSTLISLIVKKGLPLAVGCDKKKAPGFVYEVATKIGARLISPEDDLKVDEKHESTKKYREQTQNTHEMDALASALFAFKTYRALFEKIENTLRRENKLEKMNDVVKAVFSTEEGLPIKLALEIVERPDDENVMAIKKAIEKRELSKEYLRMYGSFSFKNDLLEKENMHLTEYNRKLLREKEMLKRDFKKMVEEIRKRQEKRSEPVLNEKLKRMHGEAESYRKTAEEKQEAIGRLMRKIEGLNFILYNSEKYAIIRKIPNLGEGYAKEKESVKQDEVVYISDASIFSEANAKDLRKKTSVIITDKPNKVVKEWFVVIEKREIESIHHRETDEFLFVDRHEFDRILDKATMFEKIVKEYKDERES